MTSSSGLQARVAILLSTYNGERFLSAQIDSILQQSHRNTVIFARDDGSSDATLPMLERYARIHENFRLIRGRHRGVPRSYFELLYGIQDEWDYVAFADQDDVWHSDHIERGIRAIGGRPAAARVMYCSAVEVASADLETTALMQSRGLGGLAHALVENVVIGCTAIVNRATWKFVTGHAKPQRAIMHDWWLYLVLSAFGEIVADPYPSLRYRQHEHNYAGARVRRRGRWPRSTLLTRTSLKALGVREQAREFLEIYGQDLSPDQRKLTLEFVTPGDSFGARLAYVVRAPARRHGLWDDLRMRLRILGNLH